MFFLQDSAHVSNENAKLDRSWTKCIIVECYTACESWQEKQFITQPFD